MPYITMIETKLMSRAVAWGLAILLAGAVPWPAQADYLGKYLQVCYSYRAYTYPSHWETFVWVESEAGDNGTHYTSKSGKTFEFFYGPNTDTEIEIDNDTPLNILYIRTINKLMNDDWIPGGVTRLSQPPQSLGSDSPRPDSFTHYCQVMWKD